MKSVSLHIYNPKPFVKWVGGKTQLLAEIEHRLPKDLIDGKEFVYVEPFVGGGAALVHLLTKYPNIKHAIINDINPKLCNTYRVIKNIPHELINELKSLETNYLPLTHDERTEMFIEQRRRFNTEALSDVEIAALFIFLNRTCFNGLYRENSKGEFNVPHGSYTNPCICDEGTILADSKLLKKVTILCGDFAQTLKYAGAKTFFYFDPPYKPLSETSSFNTYVKEAFGDAEQIRLCEFIKKIVERCGQFLLSNSDVRSKNPKETFFDDLYNEFLIHRVFATRMVNANPEKRGKLTELMITNIKPHYNQQEQSVTMVSECEYGKHTL